MSHPHCSDTPQPPSIFDDLRFHRPELRHGHTDRGVDISGITNHVFFSFNSKSIPGNIQLPEANGGSHMTGIMQTDNFHPGEMTHQAGEKYGTVFAITERIGNHFLGIEILFPSELPVVCPVGKRGL